jgi:hypothetical protein
VREIRSSISDGGQERELTDRWMDELAAALGVEPLDGKETGEILRASREVAHGVERMYAPLASFLLGASVERAAAAGADRHEAFEVAVRRLRGLLPPAEKPDPAPGG